MPSDCGVAGVASVDGGEVEFERILAALEAMRARGTEHGAGFAAWSPQEAVRAKVFVRRGVEEGLEDKVLGPITARRLGRLDLGHGVYLDDRLLTRYPDPEALTSLHFLQYSRFIEAWKNIGWPRDVASVYKLWGRRSRAWIGHTRFPTNSPGFQPWLAHPFTSYETVIVHNGDLSSYGANLRYVSYSRGFRGFTGNDSEVIAHLLDMLLTDGYTVEDAVDALVYGKGPRWARLDGPFAVVFIHGTPSGPIFGAFVDRHHLRPLYAAIHNGKVMVASEAAAIRAMEPGAKPRLLRGGGYIILHPDGELRVRGLEEPTILPHPAPPSDAVDAADLTSEEINAKIAAALEARGYAAVVNVNGQRYIANGMGPGRLEVWGTVGNASLNLIRGLHVTIHGDAQEDLCDTMESGVVAVRGDVGDTLAQAMRSGEVYVAGNVGNRAGVQMKGGYLVVAGNAGDYLGEFMAGGLILVLGRVGKYTATGMVGGKILVAHEVPLENIGIAPPRTLLNRYIKSLAEDNIITKDQAEKALKARTIDELKQALGEAFKYLEKLWGSLHLGYPRATYRHLKDDEADLVKKLVARLNQLTGLKLDPEEVANRKYTIIERAK